MHQTVDGEAENENSGPQERQGEDQGSNAGVSLQAW